jgi:REP element-mobilizing transposase RayT
MNKLPATEIDSKKPEHREWYSRGYLPHFDNPDVIQMITIRLKDAVPLKLIGEDKLRGARGCLREQYEYTEKMLDLGYGNCYLNNRNIAQLVEDAFLYFDSQRYHLLAWVIMPNHAHVLVQPLPNFQIGKIVHSWKSYTSHMANKILGKKGIFWQEDFYDRYIRNFTHYRNAIIYIIYNPVKAGLTEKPEDWLFSSAHRSSYINMLW